MEGPPQPPKTQPPWHAFALELEDCGPPPQPASFLCLGNTVQKMRLCCVFCVIRYPDPAVPMQGEQAPVLHNGP